MGGDEADWRAHVPEAPLLFAGVIGGPIAIGSLTPFRNCLALASQDNTSSFRQLVRQVLRGGLRSAYRGGAAPMPASSIQFTCVGPVYHMAASVIGPLGATLLAAGVESAVMFGPEGRNVQLAHNQAAAADRQVKLRPYLKPWGPGILALWARNAIANSGIRVLSDPVMNGVQVASRAVNAYPGENVCKVLGDFGSSIVVGMISMPFSQTFYFSSTSKEVQEAKSLAVRKDLIVGFLRSQWLTEQGTLSRVLARDLVIRATYIGCMFTLFAGVERTLLSVMK